MSTDRVPNGTDSSAEIPASVAAAALGLVPQPEHMSLPKILGIITAIIGILGAVIATPLWVVGKVDASQQTATTEVKEAIETHAGTPHKDAVSKDVYVQHIKLADERHSATEKKLESMDGKLDKLLERKR